MDSFVTDTQALVKFMMGKKVINDRSHQAYQSADRGEATIIIPAIVLMEMLYLFEKNRIDVGLLQTEELFKSQNYQFEPLSEKAFGESFCSKSNERCRYDLGAEQDVSGYHGNLAK